MALSLQSPEAKGQTAMTDAVKAPPVPGEIAVPAGNKPYAIGNAVGTQNYVCLPTGWTFLGPQATLFVTVPWFKGEMVQQIMTHYLSSNPAEAGMARPTWQSSLDTSRIWGKAKASSMDPNFVAAGAIPWLLVEIVGMQDGPMGGSLLSQTTFLQRVKTTGGVAPTKACSVGAVELVPYTADYVFYRAAR